MYEDDRLMEFLPFGFPLGILKSDKLNRHDVCNHHSALDYPLQVTKFLDTGIKEGAITGPFSELLCN